MDPHPSDHNVSVKEVSWQGPEQCDTFVNDGVRIFILIVPLLVQQLVLQAGVTSVSSFQVVVVIFKRTSDVGHWDSDVKKWVAKNLIEDEVAFIRFPFYSAVIVEGWRLVVVSSNKPLEVLVVRHKDTVRVVIVFRKLLDSCPVIPSLLGCHFILI